MYEQGWQGGVNMMIWYVVVLNATSIDRNKKGTERPYNNRTHTMVTWLVSFTYTFEQHTISGVDYF